MVCIYWFFNHGFELQDYVFNGCHNLTILYFNLSDIATITVKGVNYRCNIYDISKSEANHLLENYVLKDYRYIFKIHIQKIYIKF